MEGSHVLALYLYTKKKKFYDLWTRRLWHYEYCCQKPRIYVSNSPNMKYRRNKLFQNLNLTYLQPIHDCFYSSYITLKKRMYKILAFLEPMVIIIDVKSSLHTHCQERHEANLIHQVQQFDTILYTQFILLT